jgi:hypothetical protein
MDDDVTVIGEDFGFFIIEEPDTPESPPPENEAARRVEPAGRVTTSVETPQLTQAAPHVNAGIRSIGHATANGGFAWVQNLALATIKQKVDIGKQMLSRSVYLALSQLDNGQADQPKGTVTASLSKIASYACCHKRSVPGAVTELERVGVINVTRRRKAGQNCAEENEYQLLPFGTNPPVKNKGKTGQGGEINTQAGAVNAQGVVQRDCPVKKEASLLKEKGSGGTPPAIDAGASAGADSPQEGSRATDQKPKLRTFAET